MGCGRVAKQTEHCRLQYKTVLMAAALESKVIR